MKNYYFDQNIKFLLENDFRLIDIYDKTDFLGRSKVYYKFIKVYNSDIELELSKLDLLLEDLSKKQVFIDFISAGKQGNYEN